MGYRVQLTSDLLIDCQNLNTNCNYNEILYSRHENETGFQGVKN